MAEEDAGKKCGGIATRSTLISKDNGPSIEKSQTQVSTTSIPENDFLPPKPNASMQKPRWRRVLWQLSVAVGIVLLWGLFWIIRSSLGGLTRPPTCVEGSLGLLAPDGVYGNFTLGEARAVDMAWNLVIGRGGQAVVGLVAYGVYTDALMRIIEITPVSFEMYAAMAIHPNQVWSLLPISKSVWNLRGIRPTLIMIWIVLSCIYLIALPTLADAMTGYLQRQETFIEFANETTVPYYYSFPNGSTVETLNYLSPGNESYSTICVPTFGYQWGFASYWVLVCLWSFGGWMVGTYGIWLDAQHNSRLRRDGRGMGTFLAAVELSDAIKEQCGPNVTTYSNSNLRRALRKREKIKYTAVTNSSTGGIQLKLSSI